MNSNLKKKMQKIKLFITDVDGVLTDGRIVLGNNGEEFKFFHVHDGMGIKLAQEAGLKTAIITGRESELVATRAEELGIKEVYQDIHDKKQVFEELLARYNLTSEEAVYIGDDLNDLEIFAEVGLALTVADGVDKVKKEADYVTEKRGGRGAVREAVELILEAQVN
jgi:3-deoxy-D-manno-octulosonate 8-phosphate phosphatase (KDO 8-P phosphatase)